jgi:hypothetical protein
MRKLGDVTLEHCPITLNQATSVTEACDRMRDGQSGAVLVIDNSERLVGIFTGRDAVCRVLAHGPLWPLAFAGRDSWWRQSDPSVEHDGPRSHGTLILWAHPGLAMPGDQRKCSQRSRSSASWCC